MYDRLLEGGIWAMADLEYRPNESGDAGNGRRSSPFHIAGLRPIQLARFDFEEYCERRADFSTEQWMDVFLRSAGLEPTRMDERPKLILLARLIPFVERNYNLIELGPRGTGKSYAFSEMSPYSILISGGKVSSANLFYNNARRQVGLVGHWDVVAFDEVGGMKGQDRDTMQIMKDYMTACRFSRGVSPGHGRRLLRLRRQLNQSVDTLVQNASMDLFQPPPKEFDLALIDRLHFYLPGWEVPKNSNDFLSTRFGFVTDYLAEAFRTVRKENRYDEAERTVKFGSLVEGRDAAAGRRTVSGYLKLLHPNGRYEPNELEQYVEMALEGRRRVKES